MTRHYRGVTLADVHFTTAAGGQDIFPEKRSQAAAKDRIVSAEDVAARSPEIILASWCGKKVQPERIRERSGWQHIPAVISNRIFEIKSPIILQPGPAALTEGLDAIRTAIGFKEKSGGDPGVNP